MAPSTQQIIEKPAVQKKPVPAASLNQADYTKKPTYQDLQDTTKYKARAAVNGGTTYYDSQGNKLHVAEGSNKVGGSGLAKYAQPAAPAPATPAPAQKDYYGDALKTGETAYNAQMEKIRQAQQQATDAMQRNREYSEGVLGQNRDSAMQQAYLQQRQTQKGMGQQLAALGVTGGGSEQAYSNAMNAYQNNRGQAQQSYDSAMGSLSNEHANNLSRIQEAYMNRDADLTGKMYDQAREDSRWRETYDNDNMWRNKNFDEDTRRDNRNFGESVRQSDRGYNLDLQKHNLTLDQWKTQQLQQGLDNKRIDRDYDTAQLDKSYDRDMAKTNAISQLASQYVAQGYSVETATAMAKATLGL